MGKETYSEMRARHQRESNEVACRPKMFCAFDDRQYDEGLAEYLAAGYKEGDLVRGQLGWFGHRDGFKEWYALLRKHRDEVEAAMADHDFAVDAYCYEMCNHEYGINWDADADTLACFGKEKVSDLDETQRGYYAEAQRRYWHDADENGWG